jgi:hypothetical protein
VRSVWLHNVHHTRTEYIVDNHLECSLHTVSTNSLTFVDLLLPAVNNSLNPVPVSPLVHSHGGEICTATGPGGYITKPCDRPIVGIYLNFDGSSIMEGLGELVNPRKCTQYVSQRRF